MSESFAELFEQSLNDIDMTPGAIVDATVVAIEPDFVIVNAGLKSEGAIPKSQFTTEQGELAIAVGDSVKVALTQLKMVLVRHACLAKKRSVQKLGSISKKLTKIMLL